MPRRKISRHRRRSLPCLTKREWGKWPIYLAHGVVRGCDWPAKDARRGKYEYVRPGPSLAPIRIARNWLIFRRSAMEQSRRVAIAKMRAYCVRMERVHVCVVYPERKVIWSLVGMTAERTRTDYCKDTWPICETESHGSNPLSSRDVPMWISHKKYRLLGHLSPMSRTLR